jgi:hypothetical protein
MPKQKIDSNVTGLFIAEELTPKVLPVTPDWYTKEPNSFSDFGGQLKTTVRNPINPSRQRQKGSVTDLDASGGFQQDLTMFGMLRDLQGFMYADWREKKTTAPLNAAVVPLTSTNSGTKTYAAAAGLLGWKVGHLLIASGFGLTANNGLKTVTAISSAVAVVVSEVIGTEAAPPAAAKLVTCGFQFPAADVQIVLNGSLVRLQSAATDLTTLGLIPGEWVYLGGDTAASAFTVSNGECRIGAITTTYIEFDKTGWPATAEVGTGKTIQMFFGEFLQTEPTSALIKRRTYQLQRQLGSDDNGVMSEYLPGACANEFTLDVPVGDKITCEMTYIATDNEQRTGAVGPKSGNYVALVGGDPINTSSDFSRIKLAAVDPASSNPVAMFGFATDMKITIKNNVKPTKAIGVLGAFDTSVGTFEGGGSLTAYFSSIDAVQAVRNNADITIDLFVAKKNAGIVLDVPLITLGDGRLKVEQDEAIMLPLELNASQGKFGATMTWTHFPYLPNVAEA